MEKELTKNLLKNKTCDNCYARRIIIKEHKTIWCLAGDYRPRENTCKFWVPSTIRTYHARS